VQIGRIWPEKGSSITGVLTFEAALFTDATSLAVEVVDPTGVVIGQTTFHRSNSGGTVKANVLTKGWHTLRITGSNIPAATPSVSYTLTITYTAAQQL
jgi:hypothetical protein